MLRRLAPIAVCLAFAAALAAQAPPDHGLTVEQMLQIRQATNPQFGDGFLACTVIAPRPIADGPGPAYQHVLVFDDLAAAMRGDDKGRMVVGKKDSAPAMAVRPKSRVVSFLRQIAGGPQMVTLSLDGGEPNRLAVTPPIVAYRWRPDGKAFAFTAQDALPDARAAAQKAGFQQAIVDEDWRHLSLWLWEEGKERPRQLTHGTTVFQFAWADDGSKLACACAPHNLVDDSYMLARLFTLDVASGKLEVLADNPGKLGNFAWSPDGKRLAYIAGADKNDPHAGMLYVVDAATRAVTALTPGLLGMVQHVEWHKDQLACLQSFGTATRVSLRSPDGRGHDERDLGVPPGATTAVAMGGAYAATITSTAITAPELYLVQRGDGGGADDKVHRVTDLNPFLAQTALGEQSVERIRARDGVEFEGVLIKPVGYRQGTRYPLVIVVHGGPESHFSNGWLTRYSDWGQLLAARGYVSWYPNYRASTGSGVAFAKLDHGDPMGAEFTDHLDAIDHFAKAGLIDPTRVGIGGGSYGGYTAAWAATKHSDRFAAAVSFVPFTHIPTKWMTTDIPTEFLLVHYQEKWPWQQRELLEDRSPLTYAPQCRTPLLLLGGTADPRVHPSQPFMLYRAVKFATKTPVRYVQYPGEGHGNRSNVYQYDYALRTLQWFDWYLRGEGDLRQKAMPPYDVDYVLK